MPTIFSRIIAGEAPARFVWRDDRVVAFLSIAPIRPGHTLVVPHDEVDDWLDLDPGVHQHVARVAQVVGRAIRTAFRPERVGVMIAGMEVPHVHVHLVPIDGQSDLSFAHARHRPEAEMDGAAERIRAALVAQGYEENARA